jgi:SsrA-binding protein
VNKPPAKAGGGEKLIATNPLARQNYFIDEVLEAGLVLTGTEVKSLRQQSPNLRDAFVEAKVPKGRGPLEAWLLNAHIAPYTHGNIWNHEPNRRRKLLLHHHQIESIFGALTQQGLSVIPTRMYFKKGKVKIEIGLGRGKKKHDKRESLKQRSADLEMRRARQTGKKR